MDLTKVWFWTLSLWVILQYFHLKEESLIIFTALLIIDFVLWITHWYLREKWKLSSTRMWTGLWKKIVRLTIPFTAVMILKWVGFQEISLLISTIMSILIASEWYSILRHYMYITTKKEMSEIDAVEYVLTKLVEIVIPNLKNKDEKKDV